MSTYCRTVRVEDYHTAGTLYGRIVILLSGEVTRKDTFLAENQVEEKYWLVILIGDQEIPAIILEQIEQMLSRFPSVELGEDTKRLLQEYPLSFDRLLNILHIYA